MKRSNLNSKKGVQGFIPVEEKRYKKVIFCLTEKELSQLLDKSAAKGLNKSEYIRELINNDK